MTIALSTPVVAVAPSPRQKILRDALRHPGLMAGSALLLLILFAAIFADLLLPQGPYAQDLSRRLISPVWEASGTWAHPLGTDQLGRDYLSRLVYGARISLIIGIGAALISGVLGTALGMTAGYFGGRVDAVIMWIISVRLSMPLVLVALAVVAVMGGSLEVMIGVIGLLLWDRFAVVIRSATMQIRSLDYVAAARAAGCSHLRVLASEIFPNLLNPLIVVATLEMAHAILLEAALSFLGLGVQPPLPAWGLMIAEGKDYLLFKAWLITVPGAALFLLVLAINLVGDGVRDVTSPGGRN